MPIGTLLKATVCQAGQFSYLALWMRRISTRNAVVNFMLNNENLPYLIKVMKLFSYILPNLNCTSNFLIMEVR